MSRRFKNARLRSHRSKGRLKGWHLCNWVFVSEPISSKYTRSDRLNTGFFCSELPRNWPSLNWVSASRHRSRHFGDGLLDSTTTRYLGDGCLGSSHISNAARNAGPLDSSALYSGLFRRRPIAIVRGFALRQHAQRLIG